MGLENDPMPEFIFKNISAVSKGDNMVLMALWIEWWTENRWSKSQPAAPLETLQW